MTSQEKSIYAETVELLRDVSRNHAAAAADMCASARRDDAEARAEDLAAAAPEDLAAAAPEDLAAACAEDDAEARAEDLAAAAPEELTPEVEDLGEMLRELEDVGLRAVCRLARACDERAAWRAIADAHADWLGGVILNRAAETVGRERP